MNELQVFKSDNFSVRTIDEDGEIWFIAKDVAQALGYMKWRSNLIQSVPEIWKGAKRISTPGGEQEVLCLSEQGLYFFLGRSDKKAALQYQMWIAGEVMPAIRRTGSYGKNFELNIRAAEALQRIETSSQEEKECINHEVFKLVTGRELSKNVWTAQEIGEELGWSPNTVMYRAENLGITAKTKNGYWDSNMPIWYFSKEGRKTFLDLVRRHIIKIDGNYAIYEDGHRFVHWTFDPEDYHGEKTECIY